MYNLGYSIDELISNISEYQVYTYYIGGTFKVGSPIHSPLRVKDTTPSFCIFYSSKNNKLMYKDFGTGESGDCFVFVKKLLNLKSIKEAKLRIYKDISNNTTINLQPLKLEPLMAKDRALFRIEEQDYTSVDLKYWGDHGVHVDILRMFNIISVSKLYINNNLRWSYLDVNPIYGYKFDETIKCYRPYGGKGNKFRTNCSLVDIQGYKQLPKTGKILIITKSMKDVAVLYSLGFISIAPSSEGATIPIEIMVELQQRFLNIIVLYDNDSAGIFTSTKLCTLYNLKQIFIPIEYGCKDISDLILKLQDKEQVITILNTLINV